MIAFHGRQRIVAMFLAMFAVVFQALLPAGQAVAWERGDDLLPDLLIVCTGQGISALSAQRAPASPGQPPREVKKGAASGSCPICAAHAMKVSMPPAGAPLAPAFGGCLSAFSAIEASSPAPGADIRRWIIRAPPAAIS